MKTLVIHPKDTSTDFLCEIYAGRNWSVITDPKVSKDFLVKSIIEHDRIIMLGHGSNMGLLCIERGLGVRKLIGSELVYLLREKECVCIWCNANEFVMKYDLKGFHTGMIVSEDEEAIMYCLKPTTDMDIENSNKLFAQAIKSGLYQKDNSMILEVIKSMYVDNENPIVEFNKQNLFVNS